MGGGGMRAKWVRQAALALALVASSASAQVKAPGLVFEDAQLFHPATDPSRFVSVYDSRNLEPGRYSLGLYGTYALNPMELRLEESDERSSRLVKQTIGADLVAAIGLTERFQLGLDVPYVYTDNRRVRAFGALTEDGGHNLGDVALEAKLALLPRPVGEGFGLSLVPRVIFPSGNREEFAGTGRWQYGGLLVADVRTAGKINYALNFGGLMRDKPGLADPQLFGADDDLDDQLLYGGGVTVPLGDHLDGIGEITGRYGFRGERTAPLEGLLSARIHFGGVAFTVGAGGGMTHGRGSPDFRVIAGVTPYIPEKEVVTALPDLTGSRKTWKLADDPDGDGRPNPGDTLEYAVTLVNTGTKPAEDVVLVDALPERTSFVPGSLTFRDEAMTDTADDDAADFGASNPNAVTLKIGTIGNEASQNSVRSRFRVKVDPALTELTVIRNVAVVKHRDRPSGEPLPPTETQVFPKIRERETVVVTPEKLELTRNIHFEFDRATIRRESYPVLDDVAAVLKENAGLNILVEGHTDSVGTVSYNQKLSERRAASVKQYLAGHGVAAERLAIAGRGELAPIASNETAVGRAMNRRVEFLIVNPEALAGKTVEKRPFVDDITPQSEPAGVRPSTASGVAPAGDRGTFEVQRVLATLGYYRASVTGILDAETAAAIRKFQSENGLTVTGIPDATTRKALDEALELQRSRH
ncbi:MAG: OmpA-OmpF porin, family [Candidatus Binatota bacterium]|nr:OmpA-OmpF porin, family [Candidatus Binatota bacterium]